MLFSVRRPAAVGAILVILSLLIGWFLFLAECFAADKPRLGDYTPITGYNLPDGHLASTVRLTPDGRQVVASSFREEQPDGRGYLHFFDEVTGKLLQTVSQPSNVAAFDFFADGKKILAARSDGGGFHVFSGPDWELADTFPEGRVGPERGPLVRHIKTLPNGTQALVADGGNDGAKVWDLIAKKATAFDPPGKRPGLDIGISVDGVDVSPDGKQLALALAAPRAVLYDLATLKQSAIFAVPDGIFTSVRFSTDGKWLALGHFQKDNRKSVLIWDVAKKEVRHTCEWEGLQFPPTHLAFTSDSRYVLAHARVFQKRKQSGSLVVWSVDTGKVAATFEAAFGSQFVLSADGKSLFTVGKAGCHKWDFAAIRKEFEAKAEKEKK